LRYRWVTAVLILALIGCTGAGGRTAVGSPPVDFSTPIVLFVSPDSIELQRLQQELGTDFYVVADDAMWYRASAYEMLDSLGIAHAAAPPGSARFLVGGQPAVVSWDSVAPGWFTLVYDGETEPRITYDIDIPDQVRSLLAR
jgi:hypothetical protein